MGFWRLGKLDSGYRDSGQIVRAIKRKLYECESDVEMLAFNGYDVHYTYTIILWRYRSTQDTTTGIEWNNKISHKHYKQTQ